MKSDKLTERVTIRLSKSDLAAVRRYARHHRLDESDVLRMGTVFFLRSQGLIVDDDGKNIVNPAGGGAPPVTPKASTSYQKITKQA